MLGAGEQLRRLKTTVEQLLNRSEKVLREWDEVVHMNRGTHAMIAFRFFPKDGDVVSPCSSILVNVERRERRNHDPLSSTAVGLKWVSRQFV